MRWGVICVVFALRANGVVALAWGDLSFRFFPGYQIVALSLADGGTRPEKDLHEGRSTAAVIAKCWYLRASPMPLARPRQSRQTIPCEASCPRCLLA